MALRVVPEDPAVAGSSVEAFRGAEELDRSGVGVPGASCAGGDAASSSYPVARG